MPTWCGSRGGTGFGRFPRRCRGVVVAPASKSTTALKEGGVGRVRKNVEKIGGLRDPFDVLVVQQPKRRPTPEIG
jgi:hypothetical protein